MTNFICIFNLKTRLLTDNLQDSVDTLPITILFVVQLKLLFKLTMGAYKQHLHCFGTRTVEELEIRLIKNLHFLQRYFV